MFPIWWRRALSLLQPMSGNTGIRHIPGVIVQGCYDVVCPMEKCVGAAPQHPTNRMSSRTEGGQPELRDYFALIQNSANWQRTTHHLFHSIR
jgi:hypothetical protein